MEGFIFGAIKLVEPNWSEQTNNILMKNSVFYIYNVIISLETSFKPV